MKDSEDFKSASCLITLSCWSSCFLAPTLNVLFSCPQSHNPLIRVDFTTVKWQATVCCETGRALAVICVFSSGHKAQGGREVFWGRQRWTRDPRTSEFLEDTPVYLTRHKSTPARKKTQMFFFIPCKVINKDKSVKPLGGDLRSRTQEFDFWSYPVS